MTKEQIERNRIRYGEVYDKPDGGHMLGFPMPVIEAILREQEKQDNPSRIDVFKNDRFASKNYGGFDWAKTKDGDEFWDEVIMKKDFDVFFKKYPELLPEEATLEPSDSRYLKSVELYGEENLMPKDVEVLSQIAGMPYPILKKMMDEQKNQGNERDTAPFIENRLATKVEGGFDWDETKDGAGFWLRVLEEEDFENFFFRYPELLPKKGAEEVVTEEGLSVDSFIEKNKEALQDISKTNTPLFNALNGVLAELRISYEDDAVQVEEVVEVEEDDLDLDNLMGEIDELDLDSLLDEIDDLDDL